MSLVTGLFFPVILLNQQWSPPLRLQAPHCSTFRIMCDVPSIAVFCSESIEYFPGTASKFFLKLLVTIPVAPVITGIIVYFRFHICCISIHKLLYFNFFSALLLLLLLLLLLHVVKGKVHPRTGRAAQRGNRGIALIFHDCGTSRGWGVSVTPRPLFTSGKDPVSIVQEAGWAPEPVWTCAENLATTEIRSPDRPARSQSLYRLSYPAHIARGTNAFSNNLSINFSTIF